MMIDLAEQPTQIKVKVVQKANFGLELIRALFLTQLLLAGLKLAGVGTVATWSWLWITVPMWSLPSLLILAVAFAAVLTVVMYPFRRTPGETTVEHESSDEDSL